MNSHVKPLIVQGDAALLLDVHIPSFEAARGEISAYAELEKSPEHVHTYRISPLSLWNAASSGWTEKQIIQSLLRWSRYDVPVNVLAEIKDTLSRWGKLRLKAVDDENDSSSLLLLEVDDKAIVAELESRPSIIKWLYPIGDYFCLRLIDRGTVKAELIRLGFPVIDLAPLQDGDPMDIQLREQNLEGREFHIRDYQHEAVQAFLGQGRPGTGFGTVVMPCGAGKTVVGLAVMAQLQCRTLILTTNVAAVHQWRSELLDKTNLKEEDIGEYSGDKKHCCMVTVATYQVLTWRKDKDSPYHHFDLFRKYAWGLIVYDEVHLLPAPVFRITAEIQSIRRLGLTATLIREDGAERDVFSLVGPKRYDVPWKVLETSGWIAEARCKEIRINLPERLRLPYAIAQKRSKIRMAAENPAKIDIAMQLISNSPDDRILVIGQYISQLEDMAKRLKVPIITGKTPNARREEIYQNFREGKERVIVVSKVANFAIDLPDASMAIQISGTFGSRQEEAQRLGRILRPKKRHSHFYSLVSRATVEEDFAMNRQRFLIEQGYKYSIDLWDD